jgi:hypothetical protein
MQGTVTATTMGYHAIRASEEELPVRYIVIMAVASTQHVDFARLLKIVRKELGVQYPEAKLCEDITRLQEMDWLIVQ